MLLSMYPLARDGRMVKIFGNKNLNLNLNVVKIHNNLSPI
jgi:hypothetical protein